jgi:hypothetical protein
MLQPINYSLNVKTPFEAAVEGYKVGLAGQEALAQRQTLEAQRAKALADAEKLRQEAQREKDEAAAVQSLLAKPNANADDYRRVAATLSADRRKMLQDNFDALTKEEQASQLQFGGQVMSALVGKKPDVALNLLTTRAEAERRSGREDKAKATESTIEMMRLNPDNAMHILGISMAGVPGFDKVLETAIGAVKPAEADKPTAFQQDFRFIKETFGDKAAAEFAQFGRSGIVSIPLGDGTTYVGPPAMAPGAATWQQQAPSGQAMAPTQAAPAGQEAKPVTQQGIDFILNNAMKTRRIDQATVNTLKQAFGTEGQTQFNKWLLDNNVRVIVRRGYDKATGKSVVEFSDGKVEYGTD